MNLSLLTHKYRGVIIQSRTSPISRSATLFTFGLMIIGLISSIVTKFSFTSLPNILPLILYVLCIDVLTQFAPQTRIVETARTLLYGVLYLIVTILCGVLTAYAMQRFAFPLQDHLFANADLALGLRWSIFAHFVDDHPAIQTIFHFAYDTIKLQIALPLVVLAFSNRVSEVRVYLLAFVIAFSLTILISALMPAAGPIAFVDRANFNILQFTGATPLDHLTRLREAGPLVMSEPPGGIATFPSFHATIAILTPLTLRSYPRIFVALIMLNSAMLCGTVTEGAHYFCDILAGSCMAFFAHFTAKRIVRLEDRAFDVPARRSVEHA
jgi:membrane-associated phospholipid phosphatase